MTTKDHIPGDILTGFEVHDFHHAAAILAGEFRAELKDVCQALRVCAMASTKSGSSAIDGDICGVFAAKLRQLGWNDGAFRVSHEANAVTEIVTALAINYLKGGVAVDFCCNVDESHLGTRLDAIRTFYKNRLIDVAVLIVSPEDTEVAGGECSILSASIATLTQLTKVDAHGGCPILGICMSDKPKLSGMAAREARSN